jgi:hypothetical protein
MVHILETTSQQYGMTISVSKTKVMVIAAPEGEVREPIVLRGEFLRPG